ncbi:MAG TPA: choice-of-anchor D domain-containing protein, partial [Terriglobales bacterium]
AYTIAFESVRVGSQSSKALTLTNSGTGTLTVSRATVSGPGFSLSGLSLPINMSPGQSLTLDVVFSPVTSGAASGSLSILSNSSGPPATTIGLSGTGATYQLTPSSSSLNFGNVALASTSTETITLTNTGTVPLTISQASLTGSGFGLSGPGTPTTLAVGQSANFDATFAPLTTGSASGKLSIVSDASGSPMAISLSGTGVTYQLTASPSSLSFGNVTVASNSTRAVTLTNTGTASLTISQASLTGSGFSLNGPSIPTDLAAGQSTNFNVTFAPLTPSLAAGALRIVSGASASPVTIALSGTGVTYQLSPSSTSLNFGDVAVASSRAQTITLTNTGTASLTISQASLTGSGFGLNGLILPITLAAGQSIGLNVTFAPLTTGSASGALSILSNASASLMTISLSGAGATYQLMASPSSLNFGEVALASNSTQTMTLTNIGTASLTVSQINPTGTGFSLKGFSLPMTVTAGQGASANVTFSPQTIGAASGAVTIVSDASNSPTTVALSATGVTYQLTLSPSSVSFGNVNISQNAVLPVALTNTGTANVTVSQVTVEGSDFTVSSPILPFTLTPGQATNFSVTFAPTTGGNFTGTLTVVSSATNSPLTDSLSGTGVHWVQLTWTASSSSDVTGYDVYRSQPCGDSYSQVNSSPVTGTSYVDSTVTAGLTYCYVATAVGEAGSERGNSNQAAVTIPTP